MKQKKQIKKQMFMNDGKHFFEVKIVTRSIITDFIQGVRNFLGLELKAYGNTIKATADELMNQVLSKPVEWYKIDIEEIGSGGFMVSIYGVYKNE